MAERDWKQEAEKLAQKHLPLPAFARAAVVATREYEREHLSREIHALILAAQRGMAERAAETAQNLHVEFTRQDGTRAYVMKDAIVKAIRALASGLTSTKDTPDVG